MYKTLIAVSLIAALGGFAVTSAARADAFNGEAQRSIGYLQNGRSVVPTSDALAGGPNMYLTTAPTTDSSANFAIEKSHGRP